MMDDSLDIVSEREEVARQLGIAKFGKDIPPGCPGECVDCGENHPRLVRKSCPACRVKFHGEK